MVSLLNQMLARKDRFYYAIIDKATGKALGAFSHMRIYQNITELEVSEQSLFLELRGIHGGTERLYLLARYIFMELNSIGYEWKYDAFNLPSRRVERSVGFVYEGTFRQAVEFKGRVRKIRWLSLCDMDWPLVKDRLETWLRPENFDIKMDSSTRA